MGGLAGRCSTHCGWVSRNEPSDFSIGDRRPRTADREPQVSFNSLATVKIKRDFTRRAVSNEVETDQFMNNSKLLLLLSCLFAAILSAPILTAAPRGGGGFAGGRPGFSGGRPGFNGGQFAGRGMGAWHGGNWHGGNWHWNGHPNHVHNNVVFIGGFGFPWWWGWGWGWGGPWWGWGGYPYGYYGYGYPYGYPYGYGYGGSSYGAYGYGNGYGAEYQYGQYGNSSQSRVSELQRRLQRAGYYHGSVDGVLGPQTRSAIRAYEKDHGDVS